MSSHFSQAAATQAWTTEEDELLVMAKKKGMQWSAISEAYFPEKSGNSCRKRYERVQAKQRADISEARMEYLSQLYQELRAQIWQPLAEQFGDKWERVESIVSLI